MKALGLLLLPALASAHPTSRIGAGSPVPIPSLAPSALPLSLPAVPALGFDPSKFDVDQWMRWKNERLRDQKAFLERERPEFTAEEKARLREVVEAALKIVDEMEGKMAEAAAKAKATLLVQSAQGRMTPQNAAETRGRIDKLLSVQRCVIHGNFNRALLRETALNLNEDPWTVLQGDEYEPKLSRSEYRALLDYYRVDTKALGAERDLSMPAEGPDQAFRKDEN